MRQLVAVGAEGIGLDDLRAGFDICLVDAENGISACDGVELIGRAMMADGLIQQRTHGAVGDQDGVLQALVEIFNSHRVCG